MNNPIIYIINKYLYKAGYNISKEEIELQLLSHPNFPNLIAVSDLFAHFEIDHVALQLKKEVEIINNLPDYFLAHIEDKGEPKLVLVEKTKESLKLYIDKENEKSVTINAFLEAWSGIVITFKEVVADHSLKEISNFFSFKNSIQIALITITAIIFVSSKPNLFESLFLLLSSIGLYVSWLIIKHETGTNSKAINKFCGAFENSSCNAVLNSKGASLLGILKLSDLGILYFSTLLLLSVFSAITTHSFQGVFILFSSLTAVFGVYSIIYQWRVVKMWCPLCLGVLAVLYIQFSLLFIFQESLQSLSFSMETLVITAFGMLLLLSIWLLIKPLLKKEIDLYLLEIKSLKFKRKFKFFYILLQEKEYIPPCQNDKTTITFGNPEANVKITLVTNPLCYYCKEAHSVLNKILDEYKDSVYITLLFNIPIPKKELYAKGEALIIVQHLFNTYHQKGKEACREIMDKIYFSENKRKWAKENPIELEETTITILKDQKVWCRQNQLNFTPALLINGRSYPKESYLITEVPFFVNDLITQQEKKEAMKIA